LVGAPLGAATGAVAGTVGAVGTAAGAVAGGPLVVNVSPGSAGVAGLGYTPQGWLRIPVQGLYARGPDYTQPSGVRVGRGSRIPEWIDTAVMQNISVSGLQPRGYYDYFVSPDRKIVVIDPQSRRVMRVLR